MDIDPELLAEAMRLCEARSKKEAIHPSLAEMVRRRRIDELKAMAGTLDLDPGRLERLRAEE